MTQYWKTGMDICYFIMSFNICGFIQIESDVFLYYQELELFQVKAHV